MSAIKNIIGNKEHAGIQFLKYVFCGGLAFVVDFCSFYILAIWFFPALKLEDPLVRLFGFEVAPISDELQITNYWIGKGISFLLANIVAYLLNIRFVFKGGRHSRHREVILFFAISWIAFALGTGAGDLLIRLFEAQTSTSYLCSMISAVLINYMGRKYFIFHG